MGQTELENTTEKWKGTELENTICGKNKRRRQQQRRETKTKVNQQSDKIMRNQQKKLCVQHI